MKSNEVIVKDINISYKKINKEDYISLTDMARYVNPQEPKIPIQTWMRNKDVIEILVFGSKLITPISKVVNLQPLKIKPVNIVFIYLPKNGSMRPMQWELS